MSKENQKFLIVNADDIGLSENVTRGIIETHKNGIVTGASLMVNTDALHHALHLIEQCPELDVGLHLNLTSGCAVCSPHDITKMVNSDGSFIGKWRLTRSLMAGIISEQQLQMEIRAQIERFLGTGLTLFHVDVHHHLHCIPSVMRALMVVLQEYHVPFARCPREKAFSTLYGSLVTLSLLRARQYWQDTISTSDAFAGLTLTGRMNKERLQKVIQNLCCGVTELMCHPGYNDSNLGNLSRLTNQREVELAALTSNEIRQCLDENGVRLTNYRRLFHKRHESINVISGC